MKQPSQPQYDRGFEPAVAAGLLSTRQAAERGNRLAAAHRLLRKHELSLEAALEVVDNRIRLHQALGRREDCGQLALSPGPRRRYSSSRLLLIGIVLSSVAIAAGALVQQRWAEQAEVGRALERVAAVTSSAAPVVPPVPQQTPESPPAIAVEQSEGRTTRVSAGHPAAVLEAVCARFSGSGTCGWMELRNTSPRYPGRRIGWFADRRGAQHVVPIRRDSATGRWFTGNGLRPLEPRRVGPPTGPS
jgi:hypothetical protein